MQTNNKTPRVELLYCLQWNKPSSWEQKQRSLTAHTAKNDFSRVSFCVFLHVWWCTFMRGAKKIKKIHRILWSRGVIPACCTVRVSARRCLTSNAIFRKKKRLIALSDWAGDEWRLAIWEGRSSPARSALEPMASKSSCVHKRWMGATLGILPRPVRVHV